MKYFGCHLQNQNLSSKRKTRIFNRLKGRRYLRYARHDFSRDEALPKEPYRIEPYAIYLLHAGELELTIDLHHYKIIAPSVFVLAPTVIRQCGSKEKGFECQGIFFNKDYFLQNQPDTKFLDRYDFFYLNQKYVFPLSATQYEKFRTYFDLVKQNAEENTSYTSNILRSLIYILLHEVAAVNGENTMNDRKPFDRNEKILFDFKNLLSRDYKRHRSVSYYAQLLCPPMAKTRQSLFIVLMATLTLMVKR